MHHARRRAQSLAPAASTRGGGALESLVRSGVTGPGRKALTLEALKRLDRPVLPAGVSAAAAVVAESALVTLVVREQATAAMWGTRVACASALARLEREGHLVPRQVAAAGKVLTEFRETWRDVLPSDSVREGADHALRTHPLRAADAAPGGVREPRVRLLRPQGDRRIQPRCPPRRHPARHARDAGQQPDHTDVGDRIER